MLGNTNIIHIDRCIFCYYSVVDTDAIIILNGEQRHDLFIFTEIWSRGKYFSFYDDHAYEGQTQTVFVYVMSANRLVQMLTLTLEMKRWLSLALHPCG